MSKLTVTVFRLGCSIEGTKNSKTGLHVFFLPDISIEVKVTRSHARHFYYLVCRERER